MDKMAEKEEVTAETSTEDAEKVVVEPYDAADIDFDTFCKSDMRVVKVKDCVAVKKSKKLLQFTLDDRSYHSFRNAFILRTGGTGWQDLSCDCQHPAESYDGNCIPWHVSFC
mgnify:CR=1 FL=1